MESTKFGRYEIKSEIGRGGMATVYHAWDPRFERDVALKVLPREMLHDPQFRVRFEREAKTIALLEHPAIVPVYDFGEEQGQPFFVMRYMTGGSLADRMKKGPLSLQECARLFERIAPGLDEAHSKGIIHRDLKPGNILFDQYGEPYVSDFGIAKIATSTTNMTGSAIMGTPAYMSPEQAQGEGIDGRSDIYGLGVILFEMLTGRQPYQGDTPMSVVVKHITEAVPNILAVKSDLPPAVETVIEQAMAKDRNDRFQTVKALAQALESVAGGKELSLETSDRTLITPSRGEKPKVPAPQVRTPGPQKAPEYKVPQAAAAPKGGRKKTSLWIGLGVAALFICVGVIGGIYLVTKQLPFLASATSTPRSARQTATSEPVITAAETQAEILPVDTSEPPTPEITATETLPPLPSLGGADLIALLSDNEIWVAGVDGSNQTIITKDGTIKNNISWDPSGKNIYYLSGKCIKYASYPDGTIVEVTCFPGADYLDSFSISPDGTQVAISLNRVLYVVPFDIPAISQARSAQQLIDMKGCFTYGPPNQGPSMETLWSRDGKWLAVNTKVPLNGILAEEIHIYNIYGCPSSSIFAMDSFPASRFTMSKYPAHPDIPSFTWDGQFLFILNSMTRYDFGPLYEYNEDKKKARTIDPLGTGCCYTMGRFSPDGSQLLFAYQNGATGSSQTELYIISYGSIGSGEKYTPLPLTGLFTNPNNHLEAALRPVR
jgi:serine/threonine protein kinase